MPNEVYTYSTVRWPLTWFVQRDKVAHYELPPAEIEAAVVALSHQFWGEAGRPVSPPNPLGAVALWLGTCITWIAPACVALLFLGNDFVEPEFSQRVANAFPRLFAIVTEKERGNVAFFTLSALLALVWLIGSRLQSRGEILLRLVPVDLADEVVSSGNAAARGRRLRALSRVMCGCGFAVFAGCILGALAIPSVAQNLIVWLPLAFVGFGIGFWGMSIGESSAKLLAPSASDLQAKDPRKPVLFLRSFHDENLQITTVVQRQGKHGTSTEYVDVRLEEAVGDQFAPFGPLIAIGKPGEALPLLGAARNYYTDAEWKSAITRWMDQARILLVVPGLTPGLGWELDSIQRRGHVAKLLVLMPPGSDAPADGGLGRLGAFIGTLFSGRHWHLGWSYDFDQREWVSSWAKAARAAEQHDSRQIRWDTLRQSFVNVPAFADLPEQVPEGLIALHLGGDGTPTLIRGGSMEGSYEQAIRFAIYGMFIRGFAGIDRVPHALSRKM